MAKIVMPKPAAPISPRRSHRARGGERAGDRADAADGHQHADERVRLAERVRELEDQRLAEADHEHAQRAGADQPLEVGRAGDVARAGGDRGARVLVRLGLAARGA